MFHNLLLRWNNRIELLSKIQIFKSHRKKRKNVNLLEKCQPASAEVTSDFSVEVDSMSDYSEDHKNLFLESDHSDWYDVFSQLWIKQRNVINLYLHLIGTSFTKNILIS
jgi:hypothetical protein